MGEAIQSFRVSEVAERVDLHRERDTELDNLRGGRVMVEYIQVVTWQNV